jgi:hypothetical protein
LFELLLAFLNFFSMIILFSFPSLSLSLSPFPFHFSELISDRFGNYAMQTALSCCDRQLVIEFNQRLTPHLPQLRDNVRVKWRKLLDAALIRKNAPMGPPVVTDVPTTYAPDQTFQLQGHTPPPVGTMPTGPIDVAATGSTPPPTTIVPLPQSVQPVGDPANVVGHRL